ncbi:MAG: response regulator transcription factor [Anaerolineae bacterium]|nr:response regulator transcription factor [Anaerolineae bacterium]
MQPIYRSTNSLGPILEPLSERELEVLQWLASGASNREIGWRLYITESTVKRHVYNIFGKLNVRNRTQAALQARKLGVAPYPNLLQLWEEGWGKKIIPKSRSKIIER